jgi:DNA-binding transcriptional LysR family regulator
MDKSRPGGQVHGIPPAQLARLERTCGGPLTHRQPGSHAPATLTPLGEQLSQQARDYLGLTAARPGHLTRQGHAMAGVPLASGSQAGYVG